ncbi:MAG: class I SAM-dependent methyltransferase, partial [Planctomycetota bacterium]|nr:class I SAM-dependent methyltransferase [Planctomycetota bacterium]
DLCVGKTVLDLCCYTGGFSLAAAYGGAEAVIGVDLDEAAIEQAEKNAALNELDVAFQHADVFDYLRAGPTAQVVILDPPKLAKRKDELPRARNKSIDMHELALKAVAPNGVLLTFSCTGLFSPDDLEFHVRVGAARAGRSVRVLNRLSQPPDHPVHVDCPEGRYLCGSLCYVS